MHMKGVRYYNKEVTKKEKWETMLDANKNVSIVAKNKKCKKSYENLMYAFKCTKTTITNHVDIYTYKL